jgi:hypothetical protein
VTDEAAPVPAPKEHLPLLRLPTRLLAIALAGQRLLDAELLAGLQVKRMPLDFANDVFQHHFFLETTERVLQRLAFMERYVSQMALQVLTRCDFVIPFKSTRSDGPTT